MPDVAARMLAEFRRQQAHIDPATNLFCPLSTQELAVLDCIARGMTSPEITTALTVSRERVQAHFRSILAKLQVNDRTLAVITAIQHGWVTRCGAVGPQTAEQPRARAVGGE